MSYAYMIMHISIKLIYSILDHTASSEERHSIRSDSEQSTTESSPQPNINMNKNTQNEKEETRYRGCEITAVHFIVSINFGRGRIFLFSVFMTMVNPVVR